MRDRASNLLMVGVPITEAPIAVSLVANDGLGGILIRGTPSRASGTALRAIRDAGRHGPAFVAVDEEGGRVQHLRSAIGALPSARSTPKTRTPAQYRAMVAAHGRAMRALGFTMNLGPDVDVDPPNAGTGPVGANGIGDRSYSSDPAVVADYGRAFALGMLDAGIVPVLKHFPGHGRASGDSHNIGASTPSLTSMRASDLVPFTRNLDRRVGIMTAHLYVPGLDTYPVSLSTRAVNDLLRGEFGHRGLIVTDSLSMWPIRYYYRAPDAAVLALRAGNDVLLYDDRPGAAAVIDGLVAAMTKDEKLAVIAVDANLRILAAKGRTLCDQPTPTPTTVVVDTTVTTIPTSTTPPS
jgi:beta-N-acetylhexosaminidase